LMLAIIVMVVATIVTKGAAIPFILKAAVKGAVSGLIIGGFVGGIAAALNGGCIASGILDGAINGAINGAAMAVSLAGIAGIIGTIATVVTKKKMAAAKAKKASTIAVQNQAQPLENHHFLTNKHSEFTPQFESIASKYGLNLNDSWNMQLLAHKGRHATKYHQFMLQSVRSIDKIAQGNQAIFLAKFQGLKNTVIQNPSMMYKAHWLISSGV